MKKVLFGFMLLLLWSCSKDNNDALIKQATGEVWLSGGLAYCAEQIRLDNGVTLIVNNKEVIYSFKSGDRVSVEYKEIGESEYCPPCINSEIIAIR